MLWKRSLKVYSEKKTENKRTKQARESKMRILNGYIELEKERGSDGFTVQELCRYLNISVGQFYHHFKSKEDLFFNVYYILDDQLEEWIAENPETDSKQNLIQYSVWFARHNQSLGVSFVQKMFSGGNTNLGVKKPSLAYIERFAKLFWEDYGLQDWYTFEEVVRHVRIMTRGVIFDWAVHGGDYDIEQAMRAAISSTLDGILVTAENKRLYYEGCDLI